MFNNVYDYILNSEKAFFSEIIGDNVGTTIHDTIFINKKYKKNSLYKKVIRTIIILHEIAHLYKRINKPSLKSTFSPVTSIFKNRELIDEAEDGWRLENIIFPKINVCLYGNSTLFLANPESYSQSLNTFRNILIELQREGETDKDTYFHFRKNLNKFPIQRRCYDLFH